jgi:Flp pilus assembly protein TadG
MARQLGPTRTRRLRIRRGQSTAEFALIAPLLFLLFLGLIEVAYLVYGINAVTNAAREGARYGISLNGVCDSNDAGFKAAVHRADQGVGPLTVVTNSGTGGVGAFDGNTGTTATLAGAGPGVPRIGDLVYRPGGGREISIEPVKKSSPSPSPVASPSPGSSPQPSPSPAPGQQANSHPTGAFCEVQVTWNFQPAGNSLGVPAFPITTTARLYYEADLS